VAEDAYFVEIELDLAILDVSVSLTHTSWQAKFIVDHRQL